MQIDFPGDRPTTRGPDRPWCARIPRFFAALALLAGCSSREEPPPLADASAGDSPIAEAGPDMSGIKRFCDLPGSVQSTVDGKVTVPGGVGASEVAFVSVPSGFCVHYFAHVGNARQLRFAPGGDLFVASPTTTTTGGIGPDGLASIVVLPDDNHDGAADRTLTFMDSLPSTQGLLFANSHFYFQDAAEIKRIPFTEGDRTPRDGTETVVQVGVYTSPLHWPKVLDQADDGTIYVGNGGDQDEICDRGRPFRGGILKIDGSPGGAPVSKGFRNPIAIRCQRGFNLCFAVELAKDYTAGDGGREKLVPIRQGDDWGHPCCLTRNLIVPGAPAGTDCTAMTPEDVSFVIGDTPFGVDFETGKWAAPYAHSAFVVLHGAYSTWAGARVVAVAINPMNGMPLPGTSVPMLSSGSMSDFATGWENHTHGRPAAITFAGDGRLFVGNDNDGNIIWIAPLDLERQ
jgi:glucose/arabinose dehydrogenase